MFPTIFGNTNIYSPISLRPEVLYWSWILDPGRMCVPSLWCAKISVMRTRGLPKVRIWPVARMYLHKSRLYILAQHALHTAHWGQKWWSMFSRHDASQVATDSKFHVRKLLPAFLTSATFYLKRLTTNWSCWNALRVQKKVCNNPVHGRNLANQLRER